MWWRILMLDSTKINQSRPPLRWLANLAGEISTAAIMRVSWAEEDGKDKGFRYKIDGFLYDNLFSFYHKYGTYYKVNIDMSGPEWDDYDENGVPYWEKTGTVDPDYVQPWKFVDPWTGDAFRIIKGGK